MIERQRRSRKLTRMKRHQSRSRSRSALNLIALMDVFTVLVFFLLANSAEVVQGREDELVQLPESFADQPAEDALVVTVTLGSVLLEGQEVTRFVEGATAEETDITGLDTALLELPKVGEAAGEGRWSTTGAITIRADRQVPYWLVKRVMLACATAGFEAITLLVLQKPTPRM